MLTSPLYAGRIAVAAFLALAGFAQAGTVIPGRPDTVVQTFHEDGSIATQTTFRNGRKIGRHVAFWPGGARRTEALYDGDVIFGRYRSWYPHGQPAELKHYTDGRESGVQKAWSAKGEMFLNVEVRNGRTYGLMNAAPCIPVEGTL